MQIYGKDFCSFKLDLTNTEGQYSCLNSHLKTNDRLCAIKDNSMRFE